MTEAPGQECSNTAHCTEWVDSCRRTKRTVYCDHGDIEGRINELLDGLQNDRASFCRFTANQRGADRYGGSFASKAFTSV